MCARQPKKPSLIDDALIAAVNGKVVENKLISKTNAFPGITPNIQIISALDCFRKFEIPKTVRSVFIYEFHRAAETKMSEKCSKLPDVRYDKNAMPSNYVVGFWTGLQLFGRIYLMQCLLERRFGLANVVEYRGYDNADY
ncbi:hypothetical protein TNCT_519101 [Trichonephila clavata]|uniref:Uncharacterized protein n=1 Tax=Trichonephila clavata TaxID=2740835 RepID=A0A8X6HNY9_TRICU|nr:hypothetical protein TNCT_519101 [Trichonephila clavata]